MIHYNVVIATPGNSFTQGYVFSLINTIKFLEKSSISWNFVNKSASFVSLAREMTVAGSGFNSQTSKIPFSSDFSYDKIFWIDSDISWAIEDFANLYYSDEDIISGCYLMPDGNSPIYLEKMGPMMSGQDVATRSKKFKAQGCGFGFICIKNNVFENIPRPWFGPVPFLSGSQEDPQILLIGEDLSWSTKAINCGFEIWVDPNVLVTHNKNVPLRW